MKRSWLAGRKGDVTNICFVARGFYNFGRFIGEKKTTLRLENVLNMYQNLIQIEYAGLLWTFSKMLPLILECVEHVVENVRVIRA